MQTHSENGSAVAGRCTHGQTNAMTQARWDRAEEMPDDPRVGTCPCCCSPMLMPGPTCSRCVGADLDALRAPDA